MQTAVVILEQRFGVAASPSDTWDLLADPDIVVQCIPGARLERQRDDGVFEGAIAVKLGPTEVEFRGEVTQTLDEVKHEGGLSAEGADARGRSRARATVSFRVNPAEGDNAASNVELEGQIEVYGMLAPFARTGGVHLARRMTADFAEELGNRAIGVGAAVAASSLNATGQASDSPSPILAGSSVQERPPPLLATRLLIRAIRDGIAGRFRRLRRRRSSKRQAP